MDLLARIEEEIGLVPLIEDELSRKYPVMQILVLACLIEVESEKILRASFGPFGKPKEMKLSQIKGVWRYNFFGLPKTSSMEDVQEAIEKKNPGIKIVSITVKETGATLGGCIFLADEIQFDLIEQMRFIKVEAAVLRLIPSPIVTHDKRYFVTYLSPVSGFGVQARVNTAMKERYGIKPHKLIQARKSKDGTIRQALFVVWDKEKMSISQVKEIAKTATLKLGGVIASHSVSEER